MIPTSWKRKRIIVYGLVTRYGPWTSCQRKRLKKEMTEPFVRPIIFKKNLFSRSERTFQIYASWKIFLSSRSPLVSAKEFSPRLTAETQDSRR